MTGRTLTGTIGCEDRASTTRNAMRAAIPATPGVSEKPVPAVLTRTIDLARDGPGEPAASDRSAQHVHPTVGGLVLAVSRARAGSR